MTTANIGYGSTLKLSPDNSTFTTVGQVVDITGPGIKVDAKDVTNQDSANGFRERIYGLADGGEVTFNTVYLYSALSTLYGYVRATCYVKITFPDTHSFTCQCILTGVKPGVPLEDKQTLDVTLELTGKPTLA